MCLTHWFNQVIHLLTLICAIYHQTITIVLFLWSFPSCLKLKDSKWKKNINTKSDEQLLIMQATIEANRQDYDEKINNPT